MIRRPGSIGITEPLYLITHWDQELSMCLENRSAPVRSSFAILITGKTGSYPLPVFVIPYVAEKQLSPISERRGIGANFLPSRRRL